MKKVFTVMGLVIAMVIMLSGCATPTVITEYDVEGNITKKTETSESIVEQIIASTKGKTVVAFREWYGIVLRAEPSTETLFALDIGYIHKNTGVVSVLKDQKNLDKVADIVKAIKQTDSVSASSTGISSSSGTTSATSSASETSTSTAASN